MLNCPPQALTYSTRQRKTHESSLPLSLSLSTYLHQGWKDPHERHESIHLSIRGTETRREVGRRSRRSRINKLDRSSGNFSIRSRCSWKPIHGRSTSTFFLRVRLERTDRKAGKRKDGRGIGLLGSAGWRRRGQHCATVGAILFYYASLSPFRRKTFGCLPRDNFLRYVINVYGQPRLLMLLSRLSILWFSRKEKKKKRREEGRRMFLATKEGEEPKLRRG